MLDRKKLRATLDSLSKEIDLITDERIKSIQETLLNLLELVLAENDQLRTENQKLRDENKRLKGEKGRPTIRKQSNTDISSESERKRSTHKANKHAKKKKHKIVINRVETCTVDKAQLPADAEFKGYQRVVVQDITISMDNIEFKKEVYYSPSLKKTFTARLPTGYHGEFGPRVKALILDLHYHHKMTEAAVHRFLTTHGLLISAATISRLLIDKQALFHQEKQAIVQAGLTSSTHQQMDDTGARVRGENYYTHILCNDFYTAYFTRRRKDRLTIIDILTQGEMSFQFDNSAYGLMEHMGLSVKQLTRLRKHTSQALMSREEVEALLNQLFPQRNRCKTQQQIILEASAITAYQQLPHAIDILLTDDAPQFKQITDLLGLCWVHDGRHYKKLSPFCSRYRLALNKFLTQYWAYYHQLLSYQKEPTTEVATALEKAFDRLFTTTTSYEALNDRI